MRALTRETFQRPAQFSPEKIAEEQEIARMAKAVHDTLVGVPLHKPPRRWQAAFLKDMPRSAVVQYPLPNEPEHVKMHAWIIEVLDKEVMLKTQPVTVLSGKAMPLEKPNQRAYTHKGELCYWAPDIPDDYRDAKRQRLIDLQGTVGLVIRANNLLIESENWDREPHLVAARQSLEAGELDVVRDYFIETGLVRLGQLAVDIDTAEALTPRLK
jgi:hypothetical protein